MILDEMLQKIDSVIEHVSTKLPKKFPRQISQPIFDGMRLMKRRLENNF
jgi:serine/threonine-protein kinase HipA